jgi:hypothetical protein
MIITRLHLDPQGIDALSELALAVADGAQDQPPAPAPDPSPPAAPDQAPPIADAPLAPSGVRLNDGTTFRFEDGRLILTDETGAETSINVNTAEMIPPEVPVIIGLSFAGLIGLIMAFPVGRAIARYIDRRGTAAKVSPDMTDRLSAIEQAIDSVAVEVERMSEANRYTTKLLVERGAAPDFASEVRRGDAVRASHARPSDAARG